MHELSHWWMLREVNAALNSEAWIDSEVHDNCDKQFGSVEVWAVHKSGVIRHTENKDL